MNLKEISPPPPLAGAQWPLSFFTKVTSKPSDLGANLGTFSVAAAAFKFRLERLYSKFQVTLLHAKMVMPESQWYP